MFNIFKYQFLLIFLFFSFFTNGQTIISGKVFDAKTKEPLPFVNVILKGTNSGATSDFDGNFTINSKVTGDSIVASYVGYKRFSSAVKKNITQNINVPLEVFEEGVSLTEVVINPGENPAHKYIRKTIERKEYNNKRKLSGYQYEAYNKLEFDLNNIPKKFKDKKSFKPVKFIFDNVDSTNSSEKPFLPIFMIESLSDFYYRDDPKLKKEIIKASKLTGFENQSISQVMGDMYQNVNIYENDIMIFGKNFKSPICDNAIFNYKFYLEDSLYIDGKWCYHIRFKPRRKQELLFSGNLWIADTTFGVRRLEMSIPSDANINFITSANIVQEFNIQDSVWMLKKDRLVIDFKPDLGFSKKDGAGIYGRKTTSYKNIIVNQPKPSNFFEIGNNILIEEGATKKSSEFWEQYRHDSLSANEKKIYKMIDTIQSLPIYRSWVDIITILVAGHKVLGNFEVGPYTNFISNNNIEGLRLRFGGRTSRQFSRWYKLSGYVAYGLKDEKWKYEGNFKTFISKKPFRQIIGISHKNDLEILGQSQNGFDQDNFFASFLRRGSLNSLTRVEQTYLWYEHEWFQGFSNTLSFVNRKLSPVGQIKFDILNYKRDTANRNFIRTSEIKLSTRFAYDEKYINGGDFARTSLGSKYPILQFTYIRSLPKVFEGQYDYQKFVINVNDRIRLIQLLGYTDYTIEAGKIFGAVPYPLMELHGGNQTYAYDIMSYNMMNFYEFVSDQYASIWIFHHFEGLFLNKIPLLKRLKWREVMTYKILFGSVDQSNKKELLFPSNLKTLGIVPYQEISVGVENILRFFRIDGFWRLTYTDQLKLPFGLRAGFQLTF
jgi:hypothetical protein